MQPHARVSVLSTPHSYTVAATAAMLCDILETGQRDILNTGQRDILETGQRDILITGQRDILETGQRVALGLPDDVYLIG